MGKSAYLKGPVASTRLTTVTEAARGLMGMRMVSTFCAGLTSGTEMRSEVAVISDLLRTS